MNINSNHKYATFRYTAIESKTHTNKIAVAAYTPASRKKTRASIEPVVAAITAFWITLPTKMLSVWNQAIAANIKPAFTLQQKLGLHVNDNDKNYTTNYSTSRQCAHIGLAKMWWCSCHIMVNSAKSVGVLPHEAICTIQYRTIKWSIWTTQRRFSYRLTQYYY